MDTSRTTFARLSFLITAILAVAVTASAQSVIVQGNLKDLGLANATSPNTYVQFTLQGYGSSIPRIIGSNVFVNPTPPPLLPDSNGNINGTITGNDAIDPAGTYYQVCIFFQGQSQWCNTYNILMGQSPWNLNSATSIVVPPPPTSNTLYARSIDCQVFAATSVTCVHGFGSNIIEAQCWDSNGFWFVPNGMQRLDPNTVVLSFINTQSGDCAIINAGSVNLTNQPANAVVTNPNSDQNIVGFNFLHNGSQIPDITHSFTWTAPQTFSNPIITGGSLSGTITGNPTFSGNPTITGNLTASGSAGFTGNVTATAGQNSFSAFSLNKTTLVDGQKYACSDVGINAAIAAQIALGGGTVDARGCITSFGTYTTQINDGNASGVPINLLMPHTGIWALGITDGVSCGVKVFNNSAAIGSNPMYGSFQIQPASSSVNVAGFICDDATVSNLHIRVEGFGANIFSGTATVAKAIGYFPNMGDGSYIGHMTLADLSSTNLTKVLWVNNSCCSTTIDQVVADSYSNPGVTPCFFGNGTTGPNSNIRVVALSCVHAGNGASHLVDQEWNQYGNNLFQNIYMETCPSTCAATLTDTTTPWVSVQTFGTPTAADTFEAVTAGGDVAGSTRYTFDIAAGAHAIIRSMQQGGVSTNAINNHGDGTTIPTTTNSTLAVYTTDNQVFAGVTQIVGRGSLAFTGNLISAQIPTILSGFGTSAVIQFANGTAVIQINVGTGGSASAGIIAMPTGVASNGWSCPGGLNLTAHLGNRADDTVQTASTINSVTVQNQTKSTGAAIAWTASDLLRLNCEAF